MEICNTQKATQLEAAKLFNVSAKTIRTWSTEHDAPRNDDGSYDLIALISWRLELEAARSEAVNGSTISDELERWRAARRRLAELDLAERQRQVIPASEVVADVGAAVEIFKRHVLAWPHKLAAVVAAVDRPEDCYGELKHEARQLLDDIRHGLERVIHGDEPRRALQHDDT